MRDFFKIFKSAESKQIRGPAELIDNYDPDLIHKLKADHKELLHVYGQIKNLLDGHGSKSPRERNRKISALIPRLKTIFVDHIMLENGRLYGQIKLAYSQDDDVIESVHAFKSQMSAIQKKVYSLLSSWTFDFITLSPHKFREQFRALGKSLGERINREEASLYPFYEEIPNLHRANALIG
ncbi:hemerythrin domain-containing protein [uncultured Microbulbifer sp.]|uniref:hemerythrin domain-containing protein n=1 Tax=uncultured Microbulbifer sp. TaxID=348147 RepID=UPI002617BAFE|nr:hemerythrin domain-containing protein [uncultured Microbulbifer sp.]